MTPIRGTIAPPAGYIDVSPDVGDKIPPGRVIAKYEGPDGVVYFNIRYRRRLKSGLVRLYGANIVRVTPSRPSPPPSPASLPGALLPY